MGTKRSVLEVEPCCALIGGGPLDEAGAIELARAFAALAGKNGVELS